MTSTDVAVFQPARLPYHTAIGDRFDVDKGQWKVLTDAIFPAAKTSDAIVLALSYCQHRKLDIMKRPVHIVPMWDSKRGAYVETVWPSISELRTTATRTGEYAGCDEAEFGPTVKKEFSGRIQVWVNKKQEWRDETKTLEFPEWCRVTVYRIVKGVRCKFVGPKVLWLESYATIGKSEIPNDMWSDRSIGQHEKCAEAASLRRAFPEEIGNELTAEEMAGRAIEGEIVTTSSEVIKPTGRDDGPPRSAPITTGSEPVVENVDKVDDHSESVDTHEGGDPVDDIAGDDEFSDEPSPEKATSAPYFEPQKLSSEGLTTATWTDKYIPMMQTAKTLQEVYSWIDLNQVLLNAVKEKNPQASAKIKKDTEAKMAALRSSGSVSTTKSIERDAGPPSATKSKSETRTKAKPKAEPKTKVDVPNVDPADNNPDTIIKWADAVLSRIEDPDQLAYEWESRIEPYMEKLSFPPDKDELQGVLRHHEKRLAP